MFYHVVIYIYIQKCVFYQYILEDGVSGLDTAPFSNFCIPDFSTRNMCEHSPGSSPHGSVGW